MAALVEAGELAPAGRAKRLATSSWPDAVWLVSGRVGAEFISRISVMITSISSRFP
jgi:hypothetical protein